MKNILFVILLFCSTLLFSQDNPRILKEYKNVVRIGNFITRWYYDIIFSSISYEEKLTLYSDSTYQYDYQSYGCGMQYSENKYSWSISGDTLKLEREIGETPWLFIINKKKLSHFINGDLTDWTFKE